MCMRVLAWVSESGNGIVLLCVRPKVEGWLVEVRVGIGASVVVQLTLA